MVPPPGHPASASTASAGATTGAVGAGTTGVGAGVGGAPLVPSEHPASGGILQQAREMAKPVSLVWRSRCLEGLGAMFWMLVFASRRGVSLAA